MLVGAMGDDEFERFMSELLPRIYPGFDSLEPSFNFIGKTTKGKCDAHVYHSHDDTYTAIVCTTRQSDIYTKVLDDINKLSSTKFSSKICRVLLCVNTPIKDEIEDYRTACAAHGWGLDPLSLEQITRHTLADTELLRNYFGETSVNEPVSRSSLPLRRFDCGRRMKEAREDVSLSVSRLIEEIDFPSEREWNAIEAGEHEVTERYIDKISALTGISSPWLKHEATPKYPCESIYDYQIAKITAIASECPSSTFVAIEPASMDVILIVQFSAFRWRVFSFGFSMDFWDWLGDQHLIPRIFDLLTAVDRILKHPYGRVISKELLTEFLTGLKHPLQLFKSTGHNSYWFDDLFDLYHRYPIAKDKYKHHGDWFVRLQDEFRAHVKQTPVPEARDDDDV
jgi:hypothetical protein